MSYPWIADSDFPLVDYTTNDKGEHLVVFRDESQDGKLTYATIKADVVLAVAFKMCVDHVETEWAIRHLRSKGYKIKAMSGLIRCYYRSKENDES